MAKDIKTHNVKTNTIKTFNGTVKTFDRSVKTGQNIKESLDRSVLSDNDDSPENSPADFLEFLEEKSAFSIGEKTLNHPHSKGRMSIKVKNKTVDTIKQAPKDIKTVGTTVKKGTESVGNSIKTAQNMIKTARASAQATATSANNLVQTAKVSYEGAKVVARATIEAVKATVQAIATAIKTGAEGLAELVAAGGGYVLLALIVIIIAFVIVFNVFGIFFPETDADSSQTSLTMAMMEINGEYNKQIDEIKKDNFTDNVEISGARANWIDVFSVYAVKVAFDDDNAQDVVTMDEEKLKILKEIFWDMNEISFTEEYKTVNVITETDDGNGNIIETITQENQTFLYITVSHRSAEEMAREYNFSNNQLEVLTEFLSETNKSLWQSVLYGTNIGDTYIVDVASSQVGNVGGEPYWRGYGFTSRVEWCACFVSWCANECGYIETGVIPKYASCRNGVRWFQERNLWQDSSFVPSPGHIIFFDWSDDTGGRDGTPDHTGIVEKTDENYIYTIEGNAGDSCIRKKYPIGSVDILGYGTPAY